jgi:hypothetical protein
MSQPQQPPSTVSDSLTTVPPPAPIQVGSNGSAGGYKFDPDQVQSVINQWKTLLDNLEQDVMDAGRVASVRAPAVDPASGHFVDNGADPSGQTLLEQHQRMVVYVQNYIQALQQASGQIQQADEETQQSINQAGQGAT